MIKKAKKTKQPAQGAPWIEWQNYLLLMLLGGHIDCPPRRDNWGTMKIIDNRSQVEKKTGVNDTMDYYIRKSKEFLFRSMKTRADFEDREIYQDCPDKIAGVIEASLTAHPRDYVITNKAGTKMHGKIGAANLKPAIGMGFTEARHAFITWWVNQKTRNNNDKDVLARLMHTSRALLELYIYYGDKGEKVTEEVEEEALKKIKKEPDITGAKLSEFVRVTRSKSKAAS